MIEKVPTDLVQRTDETIGGMPVGEWRWTLPWAMRVDEAGYGYLNASYPAEVDGPHGTLHMRVRRDEDGWVVDSESIRGERFRRESASTWATCPVVRFT